MHTDPFQRLVSEINNLRHDIQFQVNALVNLINTANPGFAEAFQKQYFYEKCLSVMAGSWRLRKRPTSFEDVARIKANSNLIELLRKQAEEQGMMEIFERAEREAEHLGREMESQQSSTVIKP